MAPPQKSRKIAVMGSRSVGKSSLTENHFVESYYPTIENTFSKLIKYKNQEYQTEIIDTAGQDEYSILNSKHSIGIHGYVLVYSINSRSSLEMCKIIREKILNNTGTEWIPICLVGNKSDLQVQRQISQEEGKAVAQQWKCAWTEASARNNDNVQLAFELCIREIEKEQSSMGNVSGKGGKQSESSGSGGTRCIVQ